MVTIAAALVSSALAQQLPEWDREYDEGQANPLPKALRKAPQGIGLGFHVGATTGLDISYKKGRSVQQAVVGWNANNNSFRLSADQLWIFYQHDPEELLHFPFYFGVGGFVFLNNEVDGPFGGDNYSDNFGIRAPVSMAVNHDEVAIDFYVEIVPAISVYPSTDFDLLAGVGFRGYFF